LDEDKLTETVKEFKEKLPEFDDGRIDYHSSDIAPVTTVFVRKGNKILLMKRSEKVRTYKELWNTVAGYLDEVIPLEEKVLEELDEEISVTEEDITSIQFSEPHTFTDKKINKTWITYPVLVTVKKDTKINTDWEHTKYRWIDPEELKYYETVPKLKEGLEKVI